MSYSGKEDKKDECGTYDNSGKGSLDKQSEIGISTLKIMFENMDLTDKNFKLNQEIRRLKRRVAELEKAEREGSLYRIMRGSEDYTVVLVVKDGKGFKN
jgi:hypothetical protein